MSNLGSYPKDRVSVIDNSVETQPVNTQADGIRVPVVFHSYEGEDGVVKPMLYAKFVSEFGTKGIGQQIKNALILAENGSELLACRAVIPNSKYANAIIYTKLKVLEDQPKLDAENKPLYLTPEGEETTDSSDPNTAITRDVVLLKHFVEHSTTFTDKSKATDTLNTKYSDTADGDGFISFPIGMLFPVGRGVYGKSFNISIAGDVQLDKNTDEFRNYNLDLYRNSRKIEEFPVSLHEDAIDMGQSVFMEEYINEKSEKIRMVISDKLGLLFDKIAETTGSVEDIDILFCKDRQGKTHYQMKLDDGSASLSNIQLDGGSDGDIAVAGTNVENVLEQAYAEVFNGTVDASIEDRWEYPIDLYIDHNYPLSVKKSLVALAEKRDDGPIIIEGGLTPTVQAALQFREQDVPYNIWNKFIFVGGGKLKDPYTKRITAFTESYRFCKLIAEHYRGNEKFKPIAGLEKKLMGFIKGTQVPKITNDTQKDQLFDARVNFGDIFLKINHYNMQMSSQSKLSKLSQFNNVMQLYAIKRDVEMFIKWKRFKDIEPADISLFQQEIDEEILVNYKKDVSEIIVGVEKAPRGGKVKWTLRVKFKDINLYNDVELIVE